MTNTYAGDKKQSEGAGLKNNSGKIQRKKTSKKREFQIRNLY